MKNTPTNLHRSKVITESLKEVIDSIKEIGIESAEDLDQFIRARFQLKLLAVKSKGYMTGKDIEVIKLGIRSLQSSQSLGA
jgi:hypothetical protein